MYMYVCMHTYLYICVGVCMCVCTLLLLICDHHYIFLVFGKILKILTSQYSELLNSEIYTYVVVFDIYLNHYILVIFYLCYDE